MPQPTNAEIENAIADRDAAGLARMVDNGLDANWTGARGQTLLHGAARTGDIALVRKLLEKGAHAFAHNDDGETPADVAIAWGHTAATALISQRLEDEKLTRGNDPVPYSTLQDIRDKSVETGVSQFHYLAQRGQFNQVITLAANDPQGFTAADLLAKGPDGDTVLMKVCQQGQLPLLAKAEVWVKRPQDFQKIWEGVPSHYRKEVDYDATVSQMRQMKLQSYGKPKLKGFKK